MRLSRWLMLAYAALLAGRPAFAQEPPAVPEAPIAQPATEAAASTKQRLDGEITSLLFDSAVLGSRPEFRPVSGRAPGPEQGVWTSALRFGALARSTDAELAPQLLPIVDGFRRSLRESAADPSALDPQRLAAIKADLDDQIAIYESPGAFDGGRSMIRIVVNAIRPGPEKQPVHGLYVALDLAGSVPSGASANMLNGTTSPSRGIVGPGKYLIRLMSGDREVARRSDVRIGRTGTDESIDVIVN